MERILEIVEVENDTVEGHADEWDRLFDGYRIRTSEQTIRILISNSHQCCEKWGYLISEDDSKQFVGATLREIRLVDKELNARVIEALPAETTERDGNPVSAMFVDFITDRGVFQIVAYNQQNGYYGHHAVVISRQLQHKEVL